MAQQSLRQQSLKPKTLVPAGIPNDRLLKRQHGSDCRLKRPAGATLSATALSGRLAYGGCDAFHLGPPSARAVIYSVKSAEKTTSPQVAIAALQKQTQHTVLMVSVRSRAKRITWLESKVVQAHSSRQLCMERV